MSDERSIIRVIVDKNTVVRSDVPFSPDICSVCGFSVTRSNRLGNFHHLNDDLKAQVLAAMEKHKEVYHSPKEIKDHWFNPV